jgi:hypothetical protein
MPYYEILSLHSSAGIEGSKFLRHITRTRFTPGPPTYETCVRMIESK